jgi:hypothetical protein
VVTTSPKTVYEEFLRAKVRVQSSEAFSVTAADVNPLLKPHQVASVLWAVSGGRRAIFAAFGLGKTFMQIEAVRITLAKLGGGRGLIVCPAIGTPVMLIAYPGPLRRFQGVQGTVTADHGAVAEVRFEGEEKPVPVAAAYVQTVTKPKRRSPLNLRTPADNRSEAVRQAEGVKWLEKLGYEVQQTDTHRGRAICGKCSRTEGRPVFAACPHCHAPGFSPTTGADAGLEDTTVQHLRWPGKPVPSMPVEWKAGPDAPRRPAQIRRERLGLIVVVWDLPSLAAALVEFERWLGIAALAEVEALCARKEGE